MTNKKDDFIDVLMSESKLKGDIIKLKAENDNLKIEIEKAINDFTTSPDYNYEKYTSFGIWDKMLSRVQELLNSEEKCERSKEVCKY